MKNLVFLIPLFAMSTLAQAGDVYKYVDDRGVVHYTDKPPPGTKKAELPELQTYSNDASAEQPRTTAPGTSTDMDSEPVILPPEAAALGFYSGVKMMSPGPDETFHTADARVTAAASVQPELQSAQGHHLVFYVDGLARSVAPGETALPLEGLERGSHTVSAAVLDAQGKVLTQSPPVSFHLLPPTVSRQGRR